jgi:flagellar FliL protein
MAKDEKPKAKQEGDAAEPPAPASGGNKLVLFAAVGGAVAALALAGGGFLLLRDSGPAPEAAPPAAEESQAAAETPAEPAAAPAHAPASDDHSLGHEAAPASAGHGDATGRTLPLEVFVVNIKDHDRDRYLKVEAQLELSSPAVGEEIGKRLPQVRDAIISLLASKSFEEVRSMEGKNFLREELLLRVNALLRAGTVTAVYFTEFVVQ